MTSRKLGAEPAPMSPRSQAHTVESLTREVEQLRAGISLLHRTANLVRTALELEPTFYSVLTAVTAGVGLGMNRAMVFLTDPKGDRSVLRGAAAVGPFDAEEADRVWKSNVADAPDLEALYEAGMNERRAPGRL